MKLKIKDVKKSPFQGRTGETVDYFWYRAERLSDNTNIRFGSRNGSHEVDEELELDVQKYELPSGQLMYKEISDTLD